MSTTPIFDTSTVPFSYFGSWMVIHTDKENKLFLKNVHNSGKRLFILTPMVGDNAVDFTVTATATLLTVSGGDAGRIEFCFESANTLRIKGHGLSLDMEVAMRAEAYSERKNCVTFNFRQALRRYWIETLSGAGEMRGNYARANTETPGLRLSPSDAGYWEIAIDEFWSSWKQPERAAFDEVLAAADANFESFVRSMPAAPGELVETQRLASYINWATTVAPAGLLKRHTLLMSKNWMTSVWSWDQCFNAMALAGGQDALAMDQMLVIVDHQDEYGSYPDATNDISIHYNYSKPPVHGWTFENLLATMAEPPDAETMATMYESLSKQVYWWMTYRRKEGSELPYYLHGNDSGWDNSTMFDKGVPLEAPDLAALLVVQMDVLSRLCVQVGRSGEQKTWRERADRLFDALMAELWQGDHFAGRLANDHTVVPNRSLIPWLTLILGERLPLEVREKLKTGIERHLTEWGPATELTDSPLYDPDGYWRGPIWGPSTYIAVSGLERSGFPELAKEICKRFCAMCKMSGFAENYDAITGAPLRDPAYTWTASAFLLMLKRL